MSGICEGRVVIVTGAGRGIGAAIAASLARLGASVTLMGRHRGRLEERAAALPTAWAVPCDVTDEAAVDEAFRRAAAQAGEGVRQEAGALVAGVDDDQPGLDPGRRRGEGEERAIGRGVRPQQREDRALAARWLRPRPRGAEGRGPSEERADPEGSRPHASLHRSRR